MAELNPPQWLQAGSHPANTDRLLTQALVSSDGIVGEDDLEVSERSAGANMSVDVAAGAIFIAGSESSTQGTYHCYNDAVVNKTIAAADATNPRIDLVIAQVRDSFYSGGDDDWQIDVLTGTPAASPSEPTVPDNAIVLARVDVAASAPSITDADITDRRYRSSTPSGLRAIVYFTSSGTFTKADYPWLRAVRARVQGAGGGGGGASGTHGSAGAGGGGGGYAESLLSVDDLAAAETVTVGTGGTRGSGTTHAGDGGDSSFGSHVAVTGGDGGIDHVGGGQTASGASPGVGTAGDLQVPGSPGGTAWDAPPVTAAGYGGDSMLGTGGRGVILQAGGGAGGFSGGGYGSGGGGGCHDGPGAQDGGAGADGIVIVELYA